MHDLPGPRSPPTSGLRCPICGDPTAVAPAESATFETPCWCASTEFPAELLDRLDVADRGRSCLCPRCAAAASAGGEGIGMVQRRPTPTTARSGTGPGVSGDPAGSKPATSTRES